MFPYFLNRFFFGWLGVMILIFPGVSQCVQGFVWFE